ncbi:hypothetical protein ACFPOD_04665 [Nitratireductor kimnyeongensis]|uniref:Uncharacterized protein n=1 Tax=Nitratireductor kimnyeongensis TaxID=430679 RepID=A0ABW0T667_9HYPH|nr:hypothetical protein [Nitratireductor kimnyeongensis]QZZ34621.1 hypothetical protein KW403_12530 [Nitratireductor kimnyeongensis]
MLQKYQAETYRTGVAKQEEKEEPALTLRGEDGTANEKATVLEALLRNSEFRASDRNRRFLRFVVEETLAGRADRIKAFTIAVDVFGRDASFDATVDPIVRIAAGQLRKSLRDYYAGPGKVDPIHISIPLGAYVPVFEKRGPTNVFAVLASRHFSKWRAMVAGAGLATAFALLISLSTPFWLDLPTRSNRGTSAVLVLDTARTSQANVDANQFAEMLNDALWLNVGRERAIRSVGVRPHEKLEAVASRVRTMYGPESDVFELLTSVQVEADEVRVYWHLLNSASREVQVSSLVKETFRPAIKAALAETTAATVAAALFGYEGALAEYQTDATLAANSTED